jgi:hypothetical protein
VGERQRKASIAILRKQHNAKGRFGQDNQGSVLKRHIIDFIS